MSSIIIKELLTKNEFLEAYPIMKQLRTHLDQNTYINLLMEAQDKEGYKMFALYDKSDIVAVIGFQPMITLYYGKYIWVCDLVTNETSRSKGYGEKLLSYVHQWAKDNHYESIALSSGLQRIEAHRFYEDKMDYDKVSFVFKKNLNNDQ